MGFRSIRLRGGRAAAALILVSAGLIVFLAGCAVLAGPGATHHIPATTGLGEDLAFVPGQLRAPQRTPIRIDFANSSSVDHNLVFVTPLTARTRQIVLPGETDVVDLGPLDAGSYRFVCTVHEGMEGSLTVE